MRRSAPVKPDVSPAEHNRDSRKLEERRRHACRLSLSADRHGLERDVPQAEGIALGPDGALYLASEPNLSYLFRKWPG
ncbi:SdiA-regulated domain-containing protein [Pseudomonas sp.]|uniref:SdiA-regulated domain-containing protein n=1 Tax=Pseudomonas sp. TaxID=306 RepID=UPI003D0F2735